MLKKTIIGFCALIAVIVLLAGVYYVHGIFYPYYSADAPITVVNKTSEDLEVEIVDINFFKNDRLFCKKYTENIISRRKVTFWLPDYDLTERGCFFCIN